MHGIRLIFCMFFFTNVFAQKIRITKEDIARYLPDNPIILEAGSYDGKDTKEMAQLWPAARIYAFEPIPFLFEKTKNEVKNYPNVRCFNYALSDVIGIYPFFVSTNSKEEISASSSLMKPKEHLIMHPTTFFEHAIEVKTITVDAWAKNHDIRTIDFMWLDVQGCELKLLKGAFNILKSVKVIQLEASEKEMYEGQPRYLKIKKFLNKLGFIVVKKEYFPGDFNVLFVRQVS